MLTPWRSTPEPVGRPSDSWSVTFQSPFVLAGRNGGQGASPVELMIGVRDDSKVSIAVAIAACHLAITDDATLSYIAS